MEKGLTKNTIISELSRSPHGQLTEYVTIGQQAAKEEPEFFAHLIAWDRVKGQIRDSKVALPVVSLSVPPFCKDEELKENSLAHLALLGPREFLRALRFSYQMGLSRNAMHRLTARYLRETEADKRNWNHLALQHRHTLKELYGLSHTKPEPKAKAILFDGERPAGSVFEAVSQLCNMSPTEAAGTIMERKIPFLIAMGALGKKAKDEGLVLALINQMSPSELITNMKMLERLGVKKSPALRGALEKAMEKASKSKKNVLKTTKAAEAVNDVVLTEQLRGVQERQIANIGIEGNWLVLGDRSGSMQHSIEIAKHVAATLAKMVKGKVWLVFFDSHPQTIEVTGLPLDAILEATKRIMPGGNTSIGCGLKALLDRKEEVDGIAIVSDGGENSAPTFPDVLKQYNAHFGKDVPVYLYQTYGDAPRLILSMQAAQLDMQVFDLVHKSIDYYALPNMVATMRTNRYSLIDEIMAFPLLKLDKVFKFVAKEEVTNAIA